MHEKEVREHEVDKAMEAKGDLDLEGEKELLIA